MRSHTVAVGRLPNNSTKHRKKRRRKKSLRRVHEYKSRARARSISRSSKSHSFALTRCRSASTEWNRKNHTILLLSLTFCLFCSSFFSWPNQISNAKFFVFFSSFAIFYHFFFRFGSIFLALLGDSWLHANQSKRNKSQHNGSFMCDFCARATVHNCNIFTSRQKTKQKMADSSIVRIHLYRRQSSPFACRFNRCF